MSNGGGLNKIVESLQKNQYYFILAVIAVLFLIPSVSSRYYIFLVGLALIYSIWALGFNILFGYTGLLSFGHAAYLGIGAYTVALLMNKLGIMSYEVLLLASIASSLVISMAVGFLCVRYTEVYFALLTLAFGEFFFAITYKLYDLTGGSDGMSVLYPTFLGQQMNLTSLYYVIVIIFIVSTYVGWRIVNSPFGKTLQAIREDPVKAEFAGIPVKRYQWYSFIVSGIYSGLAGALYAPLFAHVVPDLFHWTTSGEVLFLTLIGGYRFFLGPVFGAVIYAFLRSYITAYTIYWPLILGLSVMIIALGFPDGVIGSIIRFISKRISRR